MKKVEVPFNKPAVIGRELEYIQTAISNGQISGDGEYTKLCSELICGITKSGTSLLTHSGTAALEMAAILCGLEPGDEVILPSFTFVSTANAIALRGATPVFVDIDGITLNIDPEKVAEAVTPRTRAIFAVHYAGFPAEMDQLAEIARTHKLFLVEDAAQALGSTYKGRPAGSLGDMAAFSFHETKNITCGEGGALTLNRPNLVERAEIIREMGTNRARFFRGQVDKYTWVDIGSSFLAGELVAAFLYGQLQRVEAIEKRRLALFDRYSEAFRDLEKDGRVKLPHIPEGTTGNGHSFYLLMRNIDDRDAFIKDMHESGIITPFHYVPLHSAPAGRRLSRCDGELPVTNDISARLVRLPMYFTLEDDIERVVRSVLKWFRPCSVG